MFITRKKLIKLKSLKCFERADVQENIAMACDLMAWSHQVRIHISLCVPAFHVQTSHLLTSPLTNAIARSSSHRRTVLPAIDSLQESRNDSRRSDIHIHTGNVTSRRNNLRREIKFAGMKAGSFTVPERRTRTRYRGARDSFRLISLGRCFLRAIARCT